MQSLHSLSEHILYHWRCIYPLTQMVPFNLDLFVFHHLKAMEGKQFLQPWTQCIAQMLLGCGEYDNNETLPHSIRRFSFELSLP